MSDLLVNLTSQAAQASTGGWVDVSGLSQSSVGVGSASSVLLLIATLSLDQGNNADDTVAIRFAVDDGREGPEITIFKDNVGLGCGQSLCWALTGLSGDHKFALQWMSVASKHAALDTGRVRSFQVIEITDATILVNKTSQAVDAADAGFTDIVGLTDTQVVVEGSVLLLLGNVQQTLTQSECSHGTRFTIGGVFEGPELTAFDDTADEGCGQSMLWMKSGISGSTAFALQWDEILGAVSADTSRVRSLQVIQITANVNKLEAKVSQATDTLTGSYTDVVDLVATVPVDGVDSILLFAASIQPTVTGDLVGAYRFFEDEAGEGPELYIFDDGSPADGCGHSVYWAATNKAEGDHTFSLRGVNVTGTVSMDTGRNRSLSILELTAGGPPVAVEGTGSSFSSERVTGLAVLRAHAGTSSSFSSGGRATLGVLRSVAGASSSFSSERTTLGALRPLAGTSSSFSSGARTVAVGVLRALTGTAKTFSMAQGTLFVSTGVFVSGSTATYGFASSQLTALRAVAGTSVGTSRATGLPLPVLRALTAQSMTYSIGTARLQNLRAVRGQALTYGVGFATVTVIATVPVAGVAVGFSWGQAAPLHVLRALRAQTFSYSMLQTTLGRLRGVAPEVEGNISLIPLMGSNDPALISLVDSSGPVIGALLTGDSTLDVEG